MGNLQVLVHGASLGQKKYSKELLCSCRKMSEMSTEEQMFEYPKVLKQASMWYVTYSSQSGSVVYMFLNLRFLAFKCLTLKNDSFLHVVCKNKYCVAMVHMPVCAELQKPAC